METLIAGYFWHCAKFTLLLLLASSAPGVWAFNVSGIVYGNGSPLGSAVVALHRAGDDSRVVSTETDTTGRYSLTASDGSYYLQVDPPPEAAGFVQVRVNDILVSGADVSRSVALVSGKSLFGQVKLPDGTPVKGVGIQLINEVTNETIGPVNSGDDGGYAFAVPPAAYKFYMSNGGMSFSGKPYQFIYSNAYRNTLVDSATLQDLVLPFSFLTGRTVDGAGNAVGSVELQISWTGGTRPDGSSCSIVHVYGSTLSDSAGRYAMALCDGFSYDISAIPPSQSGLPGSVFKGIAMAGDASRDLILQAGVPLQGRVTLPGGTPISNIRVQVIDEADSKVLGARMTDAAGQYSFMVPAGNYRFYIDGPGDGYPGRPYNLVLSDAYRNTSVSGPTVRDIVLPLAILSGKTVDAGGAPIGGVELKTNWSGGLRGDGATCRVVHTYGAIRSREDGSYAMAFCDGFSYSVTAVPPEAAGVPANVFPEVPISGDASKDFVLRRANLNGTVSLLDGTPMIGVAVQVINESSGAVFGPVQSGASGKYRINVPEGTYKFQVDASNVSFPGRPYNFVYSDAHKGTVVSSDTLRDITLPFVFMNGSATDSNGVPVSRVELRTNWSGGTRPDGSSCRVVHTYGSITTNSSGAYRMAFCEGFTYDLTVLPPTSSGFSNSTVLNLQMNSPRALDLILSWPDAKPPVILAGPIATRIGPTQATIVWQTNEPARGDVAWSGGRIDETEFRTHHSVFLDGLTPETGYVVTVSARDRAGNGPVTGSVLFTTRGNPDTVAPLIVTGPTVSSITHNSAVVEWETNEPATTQVGGALAASVPGLRTLHRVVLAGLSPQTVYAITVSSSDALGNGPTSRSTSFITLSSPDTTPPVITKGPWSTNVTMDSATIEWETDEPANSGVSYNDGTAYVVFNDDALVSRHRVRMTGLRAGTAYQVTVSSTDAYGNGPTLSAPFEVKTPAGADTQPPVFTYGPSVCNLNHQLIHLCFETDEPASVLVEYGPAGSALGQMEARAQLIRNHSIPVTGLQASAAYQLRVKVRDAAGNEASSSLLDVSTPAVGSENALQFVQAPVATYIGRDRVVIEWETNRPCRAEVAFGSDVLSQQGGEGSYRTRQQVVITNLQPGTTYRFRVTAADVDGNSVSAEL